MFKRCSKIVNFLVVFTLLLPAGLLDIQLSRAQGIEVGTGIFRARVTFLNGVARTRLDALGVLVLDQGYLPNEDYGWALILATGNQLETLAALRYEPEAIDELGALSQAYANEQQWLFDDLQAILEQAKVLWANQEIQREQEEQLESKVLQNDSLIPMLHSISLQQKMAIAALSSDDDDNDGLTNSQEAFWCTDPQAADSDGDGATDFAEIQEAKDWLANRIDRYPVNGKPFAGWPHQIDGCADDDQDSVPDLAERWELGLSMNHESTDGDKFDDGQELFGRTYCPGGAGQCGYGALPRQVDTWLGSEMPTWVSPPGNNPFVSAYPTIDFQLDPASIQVVAKEVRTVERTILQGEEIATGFAETDGHATTVGTIDTNTHNTWQENSTTEGGIEPNFSYSYADTQNEEFSSFPDNINTYSPNLNEDIPDYICIVGEQPPITITSQEGEICEQLNEATPVTLPYQLAMMVTDITLIPGEEDGQYWSIVYWMPVWKDNQMPTGSPAYPIIGMYKQIWSWAVADTELFNSWRAALPDNSAANQLRTETENLNRIEQTNSSRSTNFKLPWRPADGAVIVTQTELGSYSHQGIYAYDFAKGNHDSFAVVAIQGGKVIAKREDSDISCGNKSCANDMNYVTVRHDDGTTAHYWHLKKDSVPFEINERVFQGETIGEAGNTGWSTAIHLHIEVRKNGTSIPIGFEEVAQQEGNDGKPLDGHSYLSANKQSAAVCNSPSISSTQVPATSSLNGNGPKKTSSFWESIGQWFGSWWGELSSGGSWSRKFLADPLPGCSNMSCIAQVSSYSNIPLNYSDYRSDGQCGSGGSFYADNSGFYGVGGGGSGTAVNDNGDGTFDRLRVWSETRTTGEGYSTSHSELRSDTTYKEITRSTINTLVSSEAWSTATTVDPTNAATLTFNYSLYNQGSDLAVNLVDMDINILIGDLPVLTWRAPERSDIQPGQTVGPFGTDPIQLSLDQLAAIDNGAPIRIVLADYGYDDSLYEQNAWGRSVLFHVDDGLADGDRSVDTYLIATTLSITETYQDTLARYFPIEVFDAGSSDPRTGTLTNIRTPEFDQNGQISGWFDHPVNEHAWWELSISAGGEAEGVSHFKDMPAKARTDVYLRYLVDSDADGYTDRTELDAFSDPKDPEIHPRPLMIAAQHTVVDGNNATVQLNLQNNGNFDASSVEVWAIAVDDTISISDNLVGGGGRVRSGANVVLGTRIGEPDLAAWLTGTAKPYLRGQFEGTTAKTYTFRADSSGTVGNSAGLTVSWSDNGTTWSSINVGSGYTPLDLLDVADGIQIAFTAGSIAASETFVVETALPIDTFQYTINNLANYTPPLIVVSYNDPQGNHKFISDVEIAEIQEDLTFYQGEMHAGLQLDAYASEIVKPGTNIAQLIFFNPMETTITGGKLFLEFAAPDGTVAKEYVLDDQVFLPGPNSFAISWNTTDFTPAYSPAVDYHLLAFATDQQGTIIENTVKDLDQLGRDKHAIAETATASWNFGTVTKGMLLQKEIFLANTGFIPLKLYATGENVDFMSSFLTVSPNSFQNLHLTLDTAQLETGPFDTSINLRTNDPNHPEMNITVTGNVTPLSGQALAHMVNKYTPWDQYVYVPGPHSLNDAVTFSHPIASADRMHPLYVYTEGEGVLLGVGEYGPDFTGQTASFEIFGDGSDGDFLGGDPNTVRTMLAQNTSAGQPTLYLTDPSQFDIGQEIMIIQMQGTGAGSYEFAIIMNKGANYITLEKNLVNAYYQGGGSLAQIIHVPHYKTVTGSITTGEWNGASGGVVVFRALNISNTTIDVSIKGFKGGYGDDVPENPCDGNQGQQGISYLGTIGCSQASNGGGGGSGNNDQGSGGGGGYGTAGGQGGGASFGSGGSTYGNEELSLLYLGSGGGGGAWGTNPYGGGRNSIQGNDLSGQGGGAILITGRTITGLSVFANGNIGGNSNGQYGGYAGGGGSGGAIKIIGGEIELSTVQASGGIGGDGTHADGGNGGNGRIRIEYCNSLSGTTNPPASTQQITCYITRQLPGYPQTTELTLPIETTDYTRYQLQYGQRGTFASANSSQDYSITLPKRLYTSVTFDALFENLQLSTFNFTVDIGANGTVEWNSNGSEQPALLSSPELASGLNAYLSNTSDAWGADVTIPIRVTLDTSGDVFLTNFSADPGGDSDPFVGAGDLTANRTTAAAGEVVTLQATIRNTGHLPAENVIASFFAGNPADGGIYLGSTYVASMPVGGSSQASVVWDTTGYAGTIDVYVVLDAAEQLTEMNENNNQASFSIKVLAAGEPREIFLPLVRR